jgi:hypothetical protein
MEIVTHGLKGRGGSYSGVLVGIELRLNDGRTVNFSSLLIDQPVLLDKCPGCPQREAKELLPFL